VSDERKPQGIEYLQLTPEAREQLIVQRLAQLEAQHFSHRMDCVRFRAVIDDETLPAHEREEAQRLLEQAEASIAVLEVAHAAERASLAEARAEA
jgi:hypothetical protein